MNAIAWRLWGALGVVITALLATAVTAGAQSVPSNLRVVAPTGTELVDVRQYIGKTEVPTSPAADCFGPGDEGSGRKVTQRGPDALSVLAEAAEAKDSLRPLLVTDKFLAEFGLGLCGVGGYKPPPTGFWYLKVNHSGSDLGGSQVTVGPDTDVLWSVAPSFPPGGELALSAPVSVPPNTPIRIQVLAYPDKGAPSGATGAVVLGGDVPAIVDETGGATVSFSSVGRPVLSATRAGDVPSQLLEVCVAEDLGECPAERGLEILGTDGDDNVVGTLGDDQIGPRAGDDRVNARGGDDRIISRDSGRDKVKCGGGFDVVIADKRDRAAKSCERVKRGKKGKRKGKKKGKGGRRK
jgi:hypothetical protein